MVSHVEVLNDGRMYEVNKSCTLPQICVGNGVKYNPVYYCLLIEYCIHFFPIGPRNVNLEHPSKLVADD